MIYFFLFVCLVMLANLVFGELVKGEGNTVHRRIIVSSIIYLEESLRFYFLLKIKMFKNFIII